MRILHILSTPRAEGTPNLVLDWTSVPGHEQEVFVLHHAPADLTAELRSRARWYGEDTLFRGRGPRKFMRIVRSVRRVCRERRPDLVVCWSTGLSNWVCAGARWARGSHVALLVHSGNPPLRGARGDWMSRFVQLPVWLLGGTVVCCSNYVRDLLRAIPGLPDSLFATVYNCIRGLEIRDRAQTARVARPPSSVIGLMVATMEAHKDHPTLLRALPAVLARRPDFRLLLAGDGSQRRALESLAKDLGVAAAVRFLGSRRDVPELLGQADLFIFSTTRQEGLGSVLLEALAAGLPVVATDCPACREVLADGRFGVLVAPASPPALAASILECLEAKRDWCNREGIAYACTFTPERMRDEYLQLARRSF